MKHSASKLLLLSAALLCSCGETTSSLPPIVNVEIDASSPASLLLSLKQARNYTVSTELYSIAEGNKLVSKSDIYYRDHSYHFVTPTYEIGYILGQEGVYPFSVQNGSLLPGEVIKNDKGEDCHSLWNEKHFLSFASFSSASLEGNKDETFLIKDKPGRLALLDMAGLDAKNYPSLTSVKAQIAESALRISAYLTLDGGAYSLSWTVKDIQATYDPVVEEYVDNGGKALIPNASLSKAKSLFKTHNFTHTYESVTGDVIAYERFHPNYYFLTAGQEGMKNGLVPNGMVGIDHKSNPKTGKNLHGCYQVTPSCTDNGKTITAISVIEAFPYNSSTTDVSIAFGYPGYLTLWDSLEFVTEESGVNHNGFDARFRSTNRAIVNDFAKNVGALGVFESMKLTPVALDIETKDMEIEGEEEVLFTIIADNGQGMEFRFLDFGKTSVPLMESYLESLVDY